METFQFSVGLFVLRGNTRRENAVGNSTEMSTFVDQGLQFFRIRPVVGTASEFESVLKEFHPPPLPHQIDAIGEVVSKIRNGARGSCED